MIYCSDKDDAHKLSAGKEVSTVSIGVWVMNLSTLMSMSLWVTLDMVMQPPALLGTSVTKEGVVVEVTGGKGLHAMR